jgi:LPS export ABC transporter protein LptC
MSRLLKGSEDLKKTVHLKRWYILLFLLFFIFSAAFEITYRLNIKELQWESRNIPQTKLGKKIEIAIFKERKLNWLLEGQKVDFSNPQLVIFEKFFGRNIVENYVVSSDRALFSTKNNFIKLEGNVIFKNFTPEGKLTQIVKAKNAYIDLKNKKIWGTGRVIIKSGRRLITGYDYIYKIAKRKFIILHDVATTIISD